MLPLLTHSFPTRRSAVLRRHSRRGDAPRGAEGTGPARHGRRRLADAGTPAGALTDGRSCKYWVAPDNRRHYASGRTARENQRGTSIGTAANRHHMGPSVSSRPDLGRLLLLRADCGSRSSALHPRLSETVARSEEHTSE